MKTLFLRILMKVLKSHKEKKTIFTTTMSADLTLWLVQLIKLVIMLILSLTCLYGFKPSSPPVLLSMWQLLKNVRKDAILFIVLLLLIYDMIYGMIRYDMILDMIYVMIWYVIIRYVMIYDTKWYMLWHNTIWYMIRN